MCPDGSLASEVPRLELEVAGCQALHVEALRRHDRLQVFVGERLQDSGLARIVKTEDAHAHGFQGLFLLG